MSKPGYQGAKSKRKPLAKLRRKIHCNTVKVGEVELLRVALPLLDEKFAVFLTPKAIEGKDLLTFMLQSLKEHNPRTYEKFRALLTLRRILRRCAVLVAGKALSRHEFCTWAKKG